MASLRFSLRYSGDTGRTCNSSVVMSSINGTTIRFRGLGLGGTDHREHSKSKPAEWLVVSRSKAEPQPQLQQKTSEQPLSLGNDWCEPQTCVNGVHLREGGQLDKIVDVLVRMDQQVILPSVEVYISLLKACAKRKSLVLAKQVHDHLAKHGLATTRFLGEYMVSTFVKCGGLEDALQVFHKLTNRTVFSWTAVISGYTISGKLKEALSMYQSMLNEGTRPNSYTFVSLLKGCTSSADLEDGKRMHGDVLKYDCGSDLFVSTCLVDMYAKCGSIADAWNVFESLRHRDVVSWNALLAAYVQQGDSEQVLQLYETMQEEGAIPDQRTFVSVFQALGMVAEKEEEVILNGQSIRAKALGKGKTMHSFTQAKDYESYNFVANTLVSMYAKCGSIRDAHIVFEGLTHQDVVSWTAMIVGYVNQNQAQEGLRLHERMIEEGVVANNVTFVSLIQACGILADMEQSVVLEGQSIKLKSLERGKTVHAVASRNGYVSDEFVCSALVNMYGKCQSILDAEIVFDGLHQRDRVLWTTMMAAYLEQGLIDCVFQVYEEMLEESLTPDKGTVVIMIQACTAFADKEVDAPGDVRFIKARSMSIGKALHAHAQRIGCHEDIVVGSTLVNMYGKCGSIADAEIAFDSSSGHNVVLWTAILAACVQLEYLDKALQLYEGMLEDGIVPNDRTFVSAIQACGMLAEKEELVLIDEKSHKVNLLNKGRTLHADAWRTGYDTDIFVGNTLISMYGKCQAIGDSWIAFTRLTNPDIVSWTAISAAYVQQGNSEKALQLYEQLQEEGLSPNDVTFVTAVHACGLLADREDDTALGWQHFKAKSLALGKAVHGHAWMKGYYSSDTLGSSVISLYGKCGSIVDAENVFYGLSKFSVAAATAMITAYAGQGKGHKAWHLFRQKQQEGVNLDETTLTCILRVCSKVGSLDVCREIHQAVASTSSAMSPEMANNLIHSYGRCASMVEAQGVFDTLPNPDVVSWTALIAGHARQGNYMSSLQCYQEMLLAGVRPNGITFLSLLSACSHAGLVDKGVEYLESMSRDYGIAPEADHYVTVVDLLGRAGYFARAEKLLSVMPPIAASTAWLCVLAACRKHGNYLLAKEAFDCAVRLDPKRSATYVMMSNIYSDLGLWDDAKVVKELRTKESAWKKPGQSWIEHEYNMHTFTIGDHNQPRWGLELDLLQYLSTARQ